jgi:transcriptional regulator with XRE-family HTH domain
MAQQSFGEYLRQLRRQQGWTQSELGEDQFSKSYISAVERDKVIPSRDALQHLVTKLQVPLTELEQRLQQTEEEEQQLVSANLVTSPSAKNEQEILSLLEVILKGAQAIPLPLQERIMNVAVSPAQQWQERQARVLFLHGLVQQEKGEFSVAQASFEQALALAPIDYQLYICNALGTNYVLAQDYVTALRYHQRALHLFRTQEQNDARLLQEIEYSCGDDYRALGCHEQACLHFAEAIKHLRATSDLASAGRLYLSFGYCTYAALFQRVPSMSTRKQALDEIERTYQVAHGYLLQSRTLYQVSSDFSGEIHARLTQIMVLLDWSFWKYSLFSEKRVQDGTKTHVLGFASLLDDAYEQCQQILLKLLEHYSEQTNPPAEIRSTVIATMAYLIRVKLRRALQARSDGYADTATRERLLALRLCEWLLIVFEQKSFSWDIIKKSVHISGNDINYRSRPLTAFDVVAKTQAALGHDVQTLGEVCFAFGELAEEIALAEADDKAQAAYIKLADQCFQQAIASTRVERPTKERDTSYALRVYQRYIAILEKRMQMRADANETMLPLLQVSKEGPAYLLSLLIGSLLENSPSEHEGELN